MAINPDEITTVRVGQLPPAGWNMTDLLPHEVAGDLKSGSVQALADFISDYIGTVSSLAFNPTVVNDGETLPATSSNEFMFVGIGTFMNVGGAPDIVTTKPLNVLTSNGSFWTLAVELDVNVELAGIVQTVRSGYTTTTPSEDAVFNNSQTDSTRNLSAIPGTSVTEALNYLNTNFSSLAPKTQFIADGTQMVFNLGVNTKAKIVFWNGVPLSGDDWSQTGTNITLTFTPDNGALIQMI